MTAQRAEVLDSAYARDRAFMVERHLKARGIDDPLLLAAMGEVPREAFVPSTSRNSPMRTPRCPIEAGQTISQPYIVARMLELAEIKPGDKVLEVGAGSGYAAAVMSRMADKVFAIERHEELAKLARARLKRLGYANVEIICRRRHQGLAGGGAVRRHHRFRRRPTGSRGAEAAACDRRAAGHPGRARFGYQTLMRVRRTGEDSFEEEDFGAVAFVPLIGEEGWAEPERAKEAPSRCAEPRALPLGCCCRRSARKTIHNR